MSPLNDNAKPASPASNDAQDAGELRKELWRSLDSQLASREVQELLEQQNRESLTDIPDSVSRRRFMQLMGASMALAGAAGCRWDKETILPETKRPLGHVPGKSKRYATTMDLGGAAIGLMVTSHEGRPVKIEGNPAHPQSLGATDLITQATILELYDPDRSQRPVERQGEKSLARTWDEATRALTTSADAAKQSGGAGLAILARTSSSPSLHDMKRRLLAALPQARWYEYEAISRDNERVGTKLAAGKSYRVAYGLDEARTVACFDADLLREHPDSVRHQRQFAQRRDPAAPWMSRWWAAESLFSQTGAAADHRLPIKSGQVKALLLAVEAGVRAALGLAALGPAPSGGFLAEDKAARFVTALVKDLVDNKGQSVVAVGARQAPDVHAVALRLNDALGNLGKTVQLFADADAERPTHAEAIASVVRGINAGEVSTLVILGGNPAYDAPADLELAGALPKVKQSFHLGLYADETAALCTWHLPEAHYLEAWGDSRAFDGTVAIAQPLIAPLYDGRSALEILAVFAGDAEKRGEAIVKRTFSGPAPAAAPAPALTAQAAPQPQQKSDLLPQKAPAASAVPPVPAPIADMPWRQAVHDGIVAGSAQKPEAATLVAFEVAPVGADELSGNDLELVFVPDLRLWDGRYANNGWLQEMPDFMTKLTWDNALLVAPATAKELGIQGETMVNVELGGRELELPAFIMPGQAKGSVTVALGGGRTKAGRVAGWDQETEPVGFDTFRLRTSKAPHIARGVKLTATGKKYRLAATQEHHAIDEIGQQGIQGRLGQLIREATLNDFKKEPDFAQHMVHHPPLNSLWKEFEYDGHKWGMAIDLNACTGCGSCTVACQAENNIPVVGKTQVLRNREMHWIRIDRYFKGDPDDPEIRKQPVACQQCEMAPCEAVCPVAATTHTTEGLNDMVYNRCIGTRYCSNNCPYKVRRFNYFNYHLKFKEDRDHVEVLKLAFNPEVTVRARGVMEKCTFCVQRIAAVKIPAKNERRTIKDGEITTACQQACPSNAISFGDLNDKSSVVAKQHALPRAYAMLGELNTKPRNLYLAKITNPHPDLAKV